MNKNWLLISDFTIFIYILLKIVNFFLQIFVFIKIFIYNLY